MDTCFSLDTKIQKKASIIAAVSLFTDAVSLFSDGVSLINDDDLEINAVKNKYLSRSEEVSIVMKYRILSFQKKTTNE